MRGVAFGVSRWCGMKEVAFELPGTETLVVCCAGLLNSDCFCRLELRCWEDAAGRPLGFVIDADCFLEFHTLMIDATHKDGWRATAHAWIWPVKGVENNSMIRFDFTVPIVHGVLHTSAMRSILIMVILRWDIRVSNPWQKPVFSPNFLSCFVENPKPWKSKIRDLASHFYEILDLDPSQKGNWFSSNICWFWGNITNSWT
jgi:hypothetical protein